MIDHFTEKKSRAIDKADGTKFKKFDAVHLSKTFSTLFSDEVLCEEFHDVTHLSSNQVLSLRSFNCSFEALGLYDVVVGCLR